MKATNNELTVAVEAAALALYEDTKPEGVILEWDDLPKINQYKLKEAMLEPIIAALGALPDRLDPVRAILSHVDWDRDDEVYEALLLIRKLVEPDGQAV